MAGLMTKSPQSPWFHQPGQVLFERKKEVEGHVSQRTKLGRVKYKCDMILWPPCNLQHRKQNSFKHLPSKLYPITTYAGKKNKQYIHKMCSKDENAKITKNDKIWN